MLRTRMILAAILAIVTLAFAGCAAPGAPPGSAASAQPQQVVYQAKVAFNTALTAAVAYKRLPTCAVPARLPCSDPAVVAQLTKAANVADAALDAAEDAVRTPGFGTSVLSSAAAAAQAALTAFLAISSNLGVK
jgi:hypothetical protein